MKNSDMKFSTAYLPVSEKIRCRNIFLLIASIGSLPVTAQQTRENKELPEAAASVKLCQEVMNPTTLAWRIQLQDFQCSDKSPKCILKVQTIRIICWCLIDSFVSWPGSQNNSILI